MGPARSSRSPTSGRAGSKCSSGRRSRRSASASPPRAGASADRRRAVAVLLRLDGLSKRFGGLWAVRAVDLRLAEGEILGLIGPNGAGKTTLFNLIAGALPPTEGTIRFRDAD